MVDETETIGMALLSPAAYIGMAEVKAKCTTRKPAGGADGGGGDD